MAIIRHLYPGGNTRYGFYSFYNHLVLPRVTRKIVLKGGPGVGKSTFMKKVGEYFSQQGFDIEYHWCSSDNDSLDGVVIGDQQVCLVDGTAPHVVDPVYPGAVDEILNLGEFWHRKKIHANRDSIIQLTGDIGRCFNRAYSRLQGSGIAYDEWKSYYQEVCDEDAVKRNIQALAPDFLHGEKSSGSKVRHLFPGAITPNGLITGVESLINSAASVYSISGNPGTGIQDLFRYVLGMIEMASVNAEVFHNPLDPADIDLILLPGSNKVLLDCSANLINYSEKINNKFKRKLNFDQLLSADNLAPRAKEIAEAQDLYAAGIRDAVNFIKTAKRLHDELEQFYIPAMDFEAINELRIKLQTEIKEDLS